MNQSPGPRRRLLELFFPALLLGLQTGCLTVVGVYRGNQAEFDHGLLDLAPYFLLTALALFVFFWIVPMILPARGHPRIMAFLTTLGLLFWLQSSLLVWDYGVFDGSGIRWQRHDWKGWLELALWLAALGWAVARPGRLYKHARFLCLLLIGLPALGLVITVWGNQDDLWRREGAFRDLPPAQIHELSRGQNIVHVIFDAFQTDVFKELVAEEDCADELVGFVLFEENLAVASFTSYAIPAIFSGEDFDGSETPNRYYARCINELGFQNRLFDAGYRVNLQPRLLMQKGKHHQHYRIPATYGGSPGFRRRQAASQLLDIGLFRQLPHFGKRWLHNSGRWRISSLFATPPTEISIHQRAYLRDFIADIEPVLDQPAYHFIHIMPPHPPFAVLADGSPASGPLAQTRENYKHEARFTLRVFLELCARLRELGLYDDACIILHGDHGSDFQPMMNGREIELPVGRAPALLLVKAPGGRGPLRTSSAPTSLTDLPATVMAVAGLPAAYGGADILTLAPDAPRVRTFVQPHNEDPDNTAFRHFEVRGSLFDASNWRLLGEVEVARASSRYTWGEVIEFGMEGNSDPYKGTGWSVFGSRVQWSDGHRAELFFEADPPNEDIILVMLLIPFVEPGLVDQQRVGVKVNGHDLTELRITKPQGFQIRIPAALIADGAIDIVLDLPDAAVPAELGVSTDQRRLGIAISSAILFPKSMRNELAGKLSSRPAAGQ